ncbi:MAG: hypothetical protein JWP75_2047, partial [Frondihabitans sp.]|nr:hypothetical protein [Frondihabitans sp.]
MTVTIEDRFVTPTTSRTAHPRSHDRNTEVT